MQYFFYSMPEHGQQQEVSKASEHVQQEPVGRKLLHGVQGKFNGVLDRGRHQAPALHGSVVERNRLLAAQREVRDLASAEADQAPTHLNARKLDEPFLTAVADLAEQRGLATEAENLRQNAGESVPPQPVQTPLANERHSEGPSPSNPAKRLDAKDVAAMEQALEQAKNLPVPHGEEPGWFYYRKALELLSQENDQRK